MAENESGAERNLDPTEKRIREARERGQVARSRELTTAAVTITGATAVLMTGGAAVGRLQSVFRESLNVDRLALEDPSFITVALGHSIMAALLAVTPVFAATAVAAFVAPLALGGWIFSPAALIPDPSKLDPLAGLKRVFGMRGLVELGKALLKLLVVGALAAVVTHRMMGDMLSLGSLPVETSIGRGASLIMIKNQLGHAFIESTMIYATSMPFRTRSEYDYFKPAYM